MIILMHARRAPAVAHERRARMSVPPPTGWHQPVMVQECLDYLALAPGQTVVDAESSAGLPRPAAPES